MALGQLRVCYVWTMDYQGRPHDTRLTTLFPGDNPINIRTQLANLSNASLNITFGGVTEAPPSLASVAQGYESVTWQILRYYQTGSAGTSFGDWKCVIPAPDFTFLDRSRNYDLNPPFLANEPLDTAVFSHGLGHDNLPMNATFPGVGMLVHAGGERFEYPRASPIQIRGTIWRDRFAQTCMTFLWQADNGQHILAEIQKRSLAFAIETFTGVADLHPPVTVAAATYNSVWDAAELRFTCIDGSQAKVVIPAPEQALFDSSQEKVDSGVATPLISELLGHARGLSGSLFFQYTGGVRRQDHRY